MGKKLPIAINEDDFYMLINNTKKEKHKLSFLLGFGSGLRISEVVKLEPRDVNIKEKKIFIRQAKGAKDRIVPVPKGFKTKHLDILPISLTPRALQFAFKKAAKISGVLETKPEATFHSLRHGFASQAVRRGMAIHDVRTLMGHSNIATTNVYLELNPDEAIKSYEELF